MHLPLSSFTCKVVFSYAQTLKQAELVITYHTTGPRPVARVLGAPGSGFTDFRFRVDHTAHVDEAAELHLCLVKSRTTVPVRVRRRIVTILTSETSIRPIVQVTKTPRRTHSRRVRPIERTSARRMTLYITELSVIEGEGPL